MLLQSQRNVDGDWMRWIGPVTMAIGGVGSQAQTTLTMAIGGAGYDPLILVASDQFYKDEDETSDTCKSCGKKDIGYLLLSLTCHTFPPANNPSPPADTPLSTDSNCFQLNFSGRVKSLPSSLSDLLSQIFTPPP
ncbi:hypothetical protein L2E82_01830 [Cichorium intybus]|uniref:Uncharacterized protein n=1 Tax=Cichorium intybus TaxID=13427 RepID=A0ACB9H0R6_CICIN|nr:hypothetical protein L2E82_01830 [Cichorium intybus]